MPCVAWNTHPDLSDSRTVSQPKAKPTVTRARIEKDAAKEADAENVENAESTESVANMAIGTMNMATVMIAASMAEDIVIPNSHAGSRSMIS